MDVYFQTADFFTNVVRIIFFAKLKKEKSCSQIQELRTKFKNNTLKG